MRAMNVNMLVVWMKVLDLIGNCADLKNNAIWDREPVRYGTGSQCDMGQGASAIWDREPVQ